MKRKIKIGELATLTHCRVETIRFYEKAGMLPSPQRSESNYRLYSEVHLEQLLFIRRCRSLDMTLDEIRRLLTIRDTPQGDCSAVSTFLDEHLKRSAVRIAELEELRNQLISLSKRCSGTLTADQCGILKELAADRTL